MQRCAAENSLNEESTSTDYIRNVSVSSSGVYLPHDSLSSLGAFICTRRHSTQHAA